MSKYLLALCCAGMLTACGFHLRGSDPEKSIDAESVYIDAGRRSEIAPVLADRFETMNVRLAGKAEDAQYVLILRGEKFARDTLSVAADTGKVEEFELLLSVEVSVLQSGQETPLLEDEEVEVRRDITFDEDEVIGKFSEEEILREELTRDAANRVQSLFNAALRRARR